MGTNPLLWLLRTAGLAGPLPSGNSGAISLPCALVSHSLGNGSGDGSGLFHGGALLLFQQERVEARGSPILGLHREDVTKQNRI